MTRLARIGSCFLLLALHQAVEACPVCYGDTGTAAAGGMNQAILFLLGTTGVVLGSIMTFFVFMWRRIRKQQKLLSPSTFVNDDGVLRWKNQQGVPEWKNT